MRIFSVTPSPWEVDHVAGIRAGLEYQLSHDQALPNSPMWRMLEHRFEEHPMNFEIWHPNVYKMIERSYNTYHGGFPVVPACPTVEIPCLPNTWTEPPSIQMGNQTVPEPTTALLLGVGLVWMFIAKCWSRG